VSADLLEGVRKQEYPDRPDRGAFFNAASFGLLPRRAVEAINGITASRNRVHGIEDADLGRELGRAREAAARLVGCDAGDIVLSPNTTFGINLAAACVGEEEPGTILVSRGEFPANLAPWMPLEHRGFTVEQVDVRPDGLPDVDRLVERLEDDDVRALALSAVQFHTGFRADLTRFGDACRRAGVLFAVDAIQALGAVPVDVTEARIDVLASGGQKWLCSPWGSGFTYLNPGLRDRFDPPMVSWLAYGSTRNFGSVLGDLGSFLSDGRKFELATLGIQDYAGLARSVELFLEIGVDRIREHLFAVQEPLVRLCRERDDVEAATPLARDHRAGILAFRLPDQRKAVAALSEAGFVLVEREGMVRFAPHLYNSVDEMEEAVEVLRGVLE
jgi:selenocysteine lyase/cysteine desulfurase